MGRKTFNPYLLAGVIISTVIGVDYVPDVYQAYAGNPDIWWTGQAAKLGLEQTSNTFQVYIGGKRLQRHLSDRTLFVQTREGNRVPVSSADVRVRLNNYLKVRSAHLEDAVLKGPVFGAALTLWVLAAVQIFKRRRQ